MQYFTIDKYPFISSIYQDYLNQYKQNNCSPGFVEIDNGKKILENQSEIVSYISLYSVHHTAKMDQALSQIDLNSFIGSDLEIIDWGCGQGIGTLATLQGLILRNIDCRQISSIKLIEPSHISLERAKGSILKFCDHSRSPIIETVNKEFDLLKDSDIHFDPNSKKIHIFSNILDLEKYNLDSLSNFISQKMIGDNLFICVGPNYSTNLLNTALFRAKIQKNRKSVIISSRDIIIPAYFYRALSRSFIVGNVKAAERIFLIN